MCVCAPASQILSVLKAWLSTHFVEDFSPGLVAALRAVLRFVAAGVELSVPELLRLTRAIDTALVKARFSRVGRS